MALEFLTEAEIGDSGLVIRLDLEGLQTLLRALETAMEARLEPVALQGGDDDSEGEAANAFARVSVVVVEPAPAAPSEAGAGSDTRSADASAA